jgi:hypothetical protein
MVQSLCLRSAIVSATSVQPVLAPWYLVPFPLKPLGSACSVTAAHAAAVKVLSYLYIY